MIAVLLLAVAAGAHTFEAGSLALDEVAPGRFAVAFVPPRDALGPVGAPVLPCPWADGVMTCDGPLGPVGVHGLRTAPETQVLLRVRWADGAAFTELLRPGAASVVPERATGIAGSAPIGARHLLGGWDHLALVALLAWLCRGRALALAVGAFTAGHACTLGLVAAVGASLPPAPVEALIAASVVWLAREAALDRGVVDVVGSAGALGLLHGLGFAGALARIGLPSDGLWRVILGFHLGLEAAQLLWVAVLLPPIALLRRAPEAIRRLGPVGIGGIATAALVLRVAALGTP